MTYIKTAISVCLGILGLAGIGAGMLMLDKPSNFLPLIGIFVIFGSIGLPLWIVKLLWRKHESKIDVAPEPMPISDAGVRKPH